MKQFEYVQAEEQKRSAFDLSHERKTTLNMGELVPTFVHEVLPGDRFSMDYEAFLRTMPLVSPVMHRVNLYAHAFFVPYRLLLPAGQWEDFITQKAGVTIPYIAENAFASGTPQRPVAGDLFDHLGYGFRISTSTYYNNAKMSQLPLRAYHLIWNEYYRDQNFQTEYDILGLPTEIATATSKAVLGAVRKRCWEKDYFTAALPTQQRGSAVSLPLGTEAPVIGKTSTIVSMMKVSDGSTPTTGDIKVSGPTLQDSASNNITVNSGLFANLAGATGATITALRRAFALQRWYEASMRFGQRYTEWLLGVFGVVSKDARMQRPEFIGGGKLPVEIGEILQTSQTETTPQGTMAGKGMSVGTIFSFNREFDEHGLIMIITSVMPRTSYATLALRQNFKLDVFDFAFPHLAHLSEQPVYNGEVYNANASDTLSRTAWGYQPMYEEYRMIPDSVHGDFRTTLTSWGLQRDFTSLPALNESFVAAQPSTSIFPVAFANQQLILQSYASIKAIRPLPKHGTPV